MAVFDSNILIDYLRGVPAAKTELERYDEPAISIVSWIEIQVGANNKQATPIIKEFLSEFKLIPLDAAIAEKSVAIRRDSKIKLPDAIIWATALTQKTILVTRNTKDFPSKDPSIRIPYK